MFTLHPNDDNFIPTLEFILKLIAASGALYLFFIGLKRYFKDQTWKRNEFVAKEIKEFTSDKMVQNTMAILDWGSRYIELFPNKPDYDDRYVKVDRKILKSALQFHEIKISDPTKDRFTQVEVAIRDNFDCFLSYFERFENFIEAGLITSKELEPYLRYWIKTISEEMESDVRNSIYHYVDRYGYKGTQSFFRRFDKNIEPKTTIDSTRNNL